VTRGLTALLLLSFVVALTGTECPEPGPVLTACGTWSGECTFDLVPGRPGAVENYRPVIRWPKTALTWALVKPYAGLDEQSQAVEIQQAFDKWAAVCPLTFSQIDPDSGTADIVILFEDGDLGDGTRFDSSGDPGRDELGRAFFPGTSRAGLIQLDANDSWSLEPAEGHKYLPSVILHEIGHALGVEHVSSPMAVMAPENSSCATSLTSADIEAVQSLYGSADGTILPRALPTRGQLPQAPTDLNGPGDLDSDGDGLPNALEIFVLGTDPQSADSDGDGISDYEEVFVYGTPAASPTASLQRMPPVAVAQAVVPAIEAGWVTTLNGQASHDPYGRPLLYSWTQVAGPPVVLIAPNTARPSLTAPMVEVDAVVTFELMVTNGVGVATDTVSVLVYPRYSTPGGPVADAGHDQQVVGGRPVTLDGSRSADPDGLQLHFSWSQVDGQDVALSDTAASKPTFTAPAVTSPTTLTFQLTISNGSDTDTDMVEVTLLPDTADSDGDGLADQLETDFYGTDPHNPDSDGDGVPDGTDRYPLNAAFH
jgi:hypothetical protein